MRDVKNHATYVSSWFNLLKTKNHHIHITGFIIITRSDCVFNHYLTHCRRKTNLHRINERKNDLPLKSNEPLEKFCLLTAKTQEDILGCGCRNKMSASVFDDILRMTAIMICSKYQLFQSRIFVCLQLFQFSTVITLKVQCCYINVKTVT